ncbi:hypothetical protein F511_37882 [Dorcoceras hygrometricum]|uniref:Uncharacterized protein n=1 Tax=Dorcoceras hygrometricum TaxID=472368 RepID=A0A2Z7AND2_9LAMI|nr:hypothetical protein F511_37882 [Dorcoceras hygrometricum]
MSAEVNFKDNTVRGDILSIAYKIFRLSSVAAITAQAAAETRTDRDSPMPKSEDNKALSLISVIPRTPAEPRNFSIIEVQRISQVDESMKDALSDLQMDALLQSVQRTQYSLGQNLIFEIRENKRELTEEVVTLSSQIHEVVQCFEGVDLECTIVYVRCDSGYDGYHKIHLIVTVYSELVPSRLGRQNEDKAARARTPNPNPTRTRINPKWLNPNMSFFRVDSGWVIGLECILVLIWVDRMDALLQSVQRTQYSLKQNLIFEIRENKRELTEEVVTLSSQIPQVVECLEGVGDYKIISLELRRSDQANLTALHSQSELS